MAKLKLSGPLFLRIQSLLTITRIAFATYLRHTVGRRLASDWNAEFEIVIKFWRHQFTAAMSDPDFAHGRQLFDSLQTETDDLYEVATEPCAAPIGMWYRPRTPLTDVTVLYCHGGGYAFHGATSARFAAMLSHHIGAPLFAPDYRLTPEHAHPAQSDDAFSAWQYLAGTRRPEKIVVIGDSAGGHLALMLLQRLKAARLPQPAVCIGLCPWTDIGDRGASLHANDGYDLVQGWMALRFGEWLDPDRKYGRETLSPIFQDFAGLCPIYLKLAGVKSCAT